MNPCRDFGTPILLSDSERTKDKKITELFRRVHILETRLGNLLQELDKADLEIAKARYELFLIKTKGELNDKSREEADNTNSSAKLSDPADPHHSPPYPR